MWVVLPGGPRFVQGLETDAVFPVLAPKRPECENARTVWRAKQIGQKVRAVGITPLQVIDVKHNRLCFAEPLEQRAQRVHCTLTQLLLINVVDRRPTLIRRAGHLSEHGKQPHKRQTVVGNRPPCLVCRQRPEIRRQ